MPTTMGATSITFSDGSTQTRTDQGPMFLAYHGGEQYINITNGYALVSFPSENNDTHSCFNNTDSTVNGIPAYAFRPNIPGYYHISTGVYSQDNAIYRGIMIYKNGVEYLSGTRNYTSTNSLHVACGTLYMDGTVDYVQVYFYTSNPTYLGSDGELYKHFSGYMARGA